MQAKYVVTDTGMDISAFVFPEWETHADVAQRLRGQPVSAGFVEVYVVDGQVAARVYGYSHSLHLGVGEEDQRLILGMLTGRTPQT